jgi:hypothetical protein
MDEWVNPWPLGSTIIQDPGFFTRSSRALGQRPVYGINELVRSRDFSQSFALLTFSTPLPSHLPCENPAMISIPHYTLTEVVVVGIIAEVLVYGLISLYNQHRAGRKLSLQPPTPVSKEKPVSEQPYCLRDPVRFAFSGKVTPPLVHIVGDIG